MDYRILSNREQTYYRTGTESLASNVNKLKLAFDDRPDGKTIVSISRVMESIEHMLSILDSMKSMTEIIDQNGMRPTNE